MPITKSASKFNGQDKIQCNWPGVYTATASFCLFFFLYLMTHYIDYFNSIVISP